MTQRGFFLKYREQVTKAVAQLFKQKHSSLETRTFKKLESDFGLKGNFSLNFDEALFRLDNISIPINHCFALLIAIAVWHRL